MLTCGLGLTTTAVLDEVAVQPAALVTVTEKLPVLLTVICCVLAPLFQFQADPAGADSVTLPPSQKFNGPPGVIEAAGRGLTVTVTGAEVLVQPLVVIVTVYDPELFIVTAWLDAPLLQL